MSNVLDIEIRSQTQNIHRQVVRVTTASWVDRRGAIVIKKTISPLKRQSIGYQIMSEDAENIGATEVVERIINLHSVPDGVYCVVPCNTKRDWETGDIDDYDYQLVKP